MTLKFECPKDKVADLSREILDRLTQRHYSRVSFHSLFDALRKEGYTERLICEALALMGSGKIIDLENENGKWYEATIILLDPKTQEPIKNTMVACYSDDPCYGVIYYEPKSLGFKELTCWDHIDAQVEQTKMIIDPKCEKCFRESAQRVCLAHNQSLPFCEKCKQDAKDNHALAKIEGYEKTTDSIIKEHNARYWAN